MFYKYKGKTIFEYLRLRRIAKQVRDGILPKNTTQETVFEALKLTRPKNAFEVFGFLKAAVHDKDGNLKKDYGLVSVKKVTEAFATHLVDAMCSTGAGDTLCNYFYHKMGTGSTTEASGDTALVAAQAGAGSGTSTHGASTQLYVSTAVVTAGGNLNIREHGIFNLSTGGVCLDRSTVASMDLIADDQVTWSYTLTVNTEA